MARVDRLSAELERRSQVDIDGTPFTVKLIGIMEYSPPRPDGVRVFFTADSATTTYVAEQRVTRERLNDRDFADFGIDTMRRLVRGELPPWPHGLAWVEPPTRRMKMKQAPLSGSSLRFAVAMGWPYCQCFEKRSPFRLRPQFHTEEQDEESAGWKRLLELIDEAVADGREEFEPLSDIPRNDRAQIVALPPTIGRLTSVKRLTLYSSYLVRIPPEIGGMHNLEEFDPYTSYRLHWFPYEITRCKKLTRSRVSTRALYGNYKNRDPFPALDVPRPGAKPVDLFNLPPVVYGTRSVTTCSVCDTPIQRLHQAWVSLLVATDVLPLLVNACSMECIARVPDPPKGYVGPHAGGLDVQQPLSYVEEARASSHAGRRD